ASMTRELVSRVIVGFTRARVGVLHRMASMYEVVEQWKITPEGIETIDDMARPIMVEGYWQAVHHLGQYTIDVLDEEKWGGLRCPRDDIARDHPHQSSILSGGWSLRA
ncbi:hypothetical protein Dimus_030214, partial [Dionaea muscipula]